jgi:hypothetical protein
MDAAYAFRVEFRLDPDGATVAFRQLRTDAAFLDALEAAIAADLDRFNPDAVDAALDKYFGSSIHVRG